MAIDNTVIHKHVYLYYRVTEQFSKEITTLILYGK